MPLFVVRVTEVNEALQHMQRVVDAVALTELARTAHVVEFGIFQQDADVVVVAETFEQLAEGNVVETDQPFGPTAASLGCSTSRCEASLRDETSTDPSISAVSNAARSLS